MTQMTQNCGSQTLSPVHQACWSLIIRPNRPFPSWLLGKSKHEAQRVHRVDSLPFNLKELRVFKNVLKKRKTRYSNKDEASDLSFSSDREMTSRRLPHAHKNVSTAAWSSLLHMSLLLHSRSDLESVLSGGEGSGARSESQRAAMSHNSGKRNVGSG